MKIESARTYNVSSEKKIKKNYLLMVVSLLNLMKILIYLDRVLMILTLLEACHLLILY